MLSSLPSQQCPQRSHSHGLSSPFSRAVTLTFLLFSLSQITEGVKPTLSELEKFEDQPEGIDLEVVTESTGISSLSVTQAEEEGVALGRQLPSQPCIRPCREGAGT